MRNKGETLIESLISMFFITIILLPISNLLLSTYKIDLKINNLYIEKINKKNLIEILKSKKNEELIFLVGEYHVKKVDEFYSKFKIDPKFHLLKEDFENNIKIKIIKNEEKYEENTIDDKWKIKIFVDEIEEIIF